jgi:hypothetical protein
MVVTIRTLLIHVAHCGHSDLVAGRLLHICSLIAALTSLPSTLSLMLGVSHPVGSDVPESMIEELALNS